jgi:hypothetical protein
MRAGSVVNEVQLIQKESLIKDIGDKKTTNSKLNKHITIKNVIILSTMVIQTFV